MPIIGLLAFLLGIVVAYQGADQLRQYCVNIFVADLVGLSMLREFAPLITAIIIPGRSGSAYAAQIGALSVSEEFDAMRTFGIAPLDMLVLPKIIAFGCRIRRGGLQGRNPVDFAGWATAPGVIGEAWP